MHTAQWYAQELALGWLMLTRKLQALLQPSFSLRSDSPCPLQAGMNHSKHRGRWLLEESRVGGKKPGWALDILCNHTFLLLRLALALAMLKYPCLLYFPIAAVNAILSSNTLPAVSFPMRLQGNIWITTKPWFVLLCPHDDVTSKRLTVPSLRRAWAAHATSVFQSCTMN